MIIVTKIIKSNNVFNYSESFINIIINKINNYVNDLIDSNELTQNEISELLKHKLFKQYKKNNITKFFN
jgi:hypothetical protein